MFVLYLSGVIKEISGQAAASHHCSFVFVAETVWAVLISCEMKC